MTVAVITRAPAKWDGPKPAPEEFDGFLYRLTIGEARFSGWGLSWIEGMAKEHAPCAEISREWAA